MHNESLSSPAEDGHHRRLQVRLGIRSEFRPSSGSGSVRLTQHWHPLSSSFSCFSISPLMIGVISRIAGSSDFTTSAFLPLQQLFTFFVSSVMAGVQQDMIVFLKWTVRWLYVRNGIWDQEKNRFSFDVSRVWVLGLMMDKGPHFIKKIKRERDWLKGLCRRLLI